MAIRYPMIITNTTLGIGLKFIPNPNSIELDSKKIYSQTQTLDGFVFEHWGEAPTMLTVTGQTVGMLDPQSEAAAEAFLFALRQLYRIDKRKVASLTGLVKNAASNLVAKIKGKSATQQDLLQLSNTYIYYRTDAYKGFFTDFKLQQQGEKPNIYTYKFSFLVTSTAQNFLADFLFTPSTSNVLSATKAAAGAALITGAGVAANSLVDPDRVG